MTNEGQTDVDFKFRLSPEETVGPCRDGGPPEITLLPLTCQEAHAAAGCVHFRLAPYTAQRTCQQPTSIAAPLPQVQEIIERQPHPPQSLILLGRSGTGAWGAAAGAGCWLAR